MDIEANIKQFMGDREPGRRFASFDYCFNYFQSFRESDGVADIAAPENMTLSCLHLGFYLASWGMFRGSSAVPRRSLRQFMPVVKLIASTPREVWEIDAHCYSGTAPHRLLTTAREVREALDFPRGKRPRDTLVTKIMLGVFGNVPAFDAYVVEGLKTSGLTGSFGIRALQEIGRFYDDHREVIEGLREPTLDFATGQPTQRRYTRAKVIDQIFYIEGGAR